MSSFWQDVVKIGIGGMFGGGLAYLASRGRTKADTKVALAKVDADHETETRSVAIVELEASLNRLVDENKQLKLDQASDRERIVVLEREYRSLRDSERKCQTDLAFLRGKIAVLESQTPTVNVATATTQTEG